MADLTEHSAVLLSEAVDALITNPSGVYVDGTFGRGGHSALILEKLSEQGRLIGFDKDPVAIKHAEKEFGGDGRFDIAHASFSLLEEELARRNVTSVDGVLLDLGVSSPQLDQAERGFSFLQDGPLDMRMNIESGQTAAEWIASATEKEIADVLYYYGEERFSRRMAKAVVAERELTPITRTLQLAEIIKAANPRWEKGKNPATRAFQAIRIFINKELEDVEHILPQALDVLAPGGRLVVISFHSLEDRIVKRFIKKQEQGEQLPKGLPVMAAEINIRMKKVGKAIKPSKQEQEENPRARSAIMRVAEKIA